LNILAQRNDPNEVPTSHGSDESRRKPDVVFMTEEGLIEVHEINNTESDWRITLSTLCQKRLPTNTVQWGQFKATVEFERNKSNDDSLPVPYPKELRSCRDGSSSYIRPQRLGESVTYGDDAPAPPGPGLEEVVGEPVPKACTFCFPSFLFQILTRFFSKPAARDGSLLMVLSKPRTPWCKRLDMRRKSCPNSR